MWSEGEERSAQPSGGSRVDEQLLTSSTASHGPEPSASARVHLCARAESEAGRQYPVLRCQSAIGTIHARAANWTGDVELVNIDRQEQK